MSSGTCDEKKDSFGPYWSKSLCIKLIELYKKHELLWDVGHTEYYTRASKERAWKLIAEEMELPVWAVKQKITNILGCYRRYRSRSREKQRGGAGPHREIQWFGFKLLSFLDSNREKRLLIFGHKNTNKPTKKTEPDFDRSITEESVTPIPLKKQKTATKTKTHERVEPIHSTNKPKELLKRKIDETNETESNDPYYVYGLYIANELRKYDNMTLAHVKHSINNILFKADLKQLSDDTENKRNHKRDPLLPEIEVSFETEVVDDNESEEIKSESYFEDTVANDNESTSSE